MTARSFTRICLIALGLWTANRAQTTATLSVTPNPAPADKPFTLTLSGVNATCGTVFSRESVTVAGNRIDLRYTSATLYYPQSAIPCPAYPIGQGGAAASGDAAGAASILPPNAPVFSMPALKAGSYEVWAENVPSCAYSQPACLIRTLPVSAGTLVVKADSGSAPSMYITPADTLAGHAFDLTLWSYGWNCGTVFDSAYATVYGNAITLNYQKHQNKSAVCPAIYRPYGVTFHIPALKAGTYSVAAWDLDRCAPPPRSVDCRAMLKPDFAGTLLLRDGPVRPGWFLKEHTQAARTPFTLQLLNYAYSVCGTAFGHLNQAVAPNGILLSFTVATNLPMGCANGTTPWGPSFQMPALATGIYPVRVQVQPTCLYEQPACVIDPIPGITPPSDTLVVTAESAVLLSGLRARGLQAGFQGARVRFALPGEGSWGAELSDLSGKRVAAGRAVPEAEGRGSLALPEEPAPGIYLLRLRRADGESLTLPVIR
jgi:hypothetical protein